MSVCLSIANINLYARYTQTKQQKEISEEVVKNSLIYWRTTTQKRVEEKKIHYSYMACICIYYFHVFCLCECDLQRLTEFDLFPISSSLPSFVSVCFQPNSGRAAREMWNHACWHVQHIHMCVCVFVIL